MQLFVWKTVKAMKIQSFQKSARKMEAFLSAASGIFFLFFFIRFKM